MEYGIIMACVSLFGTLALVLADETADMDVTDTANKVPVCADDGMRQAA